MNFLGYLANKIANFDESKPLQSKFRIRRIKPLISMIEKNFNKYGHVKILDIGGARGYWNVVPANILADNKVSITLINISSNQLGKPPEPEAHFEYVEGDACDLSCYADKAFHIVHSNSVIEHVGDWKRMKKFASEARRVGTDLFIQTPNFWFFWETHYNAPFFHWLPEPMQVWLFIHAIPTSSAKNVDEAMVDVENAHLIDKAMMQALFPDAVILEEKFLFMTKSLVAVRQEL